MQKTKKGTPKGTQITFKSLKTNTNRMTNEEHGARNYMGIDHGCDSAVSRPYFPLLSYSSLLFLSIPSPLNAGTSPQPPQHAYLQENGQLGVMAARPSELMLTPEVIGSPRRVGSFNPKQFRGLGELEASLGELEASLGELESRKLTENTLLPLSFGIFCILDQNIKQSFVLCGNWCRTAQFSQRESKHQ